MTTRRQMLAIGVQPFEQGQEFEHWPLHITLVPWFENAKQSKLHDSLERIQTRVKPFYVDLGSRALFGAENNMPVRLVDSDQLMEIHCDLVRIVEVVGSKVDPRFTGKRFQPHITEKRQTIDQTILPVVQFALVDDIGDHKRHVTEVFEFGK